MINFTVDTWVSIGIFLFGLGTAITGISSLVDSICSQYLEYKRDKDIVRFTTSNHYID